MADRPEIFAPNRGFSGMTDSMEPCKMLCGRLSQRNLAMARRSSRLPACLVFFTAHCIAYRLFAMDVLMKDDDDAMLFAIPIFHCLFTIFTTVVFF